MQRYKLFVVITRLLREDDTVFMTDRHIGESLADTHRVASKDARSIMDNCVDVAKAQLILRFKKD